MKSIPWHTHGTSAMSYEYLNEYLLFRIPASYNVDWDVWAELLPEQLPELLHKLT